jgi:hypothetical protein
VDFSPRQDRQQLLAFAFAFAVVFGSGLPN